MMQELFLQAVNILADMAIDAMKSGISGIIEKRKLKAELETYLTRKLEQNKTCSIAEEIDFEGLLEYIRDEYADAVQQYLLGSREERLAALERINNGACYFAKAENAIARDRVNRIMSDVFGILADFLEKKIPPEYKYHSTKVAEDVCKHFDDKLETASENLLAKVSDVVKTASADFSEAQQIARDTEQIQSIDKFIEQYDSNALAAALNTTFQFREAELARIKDAFSKFSVVLLTGKAGVGKTRLALEFAKLHAQTVSETVYCIHNKALGIYSDLRYYFKNPGRYLVIIDDANQLSQLGLILEYVNKAVQGYDVKIIATVRSYALKKVKKDMEGLVLYQEISINTFTDTEIQNIISEQYPELNTTALNRISELANGNARMAMLAGKIAFDTDRIGSISDVSQLYEAYYGKAFEEAKLDQDMALQISAGIVAFLNSIHLDYLEHIEGVLKHVGMDASEFKSAVIKLHELEIVDICHDKAVSFSDQCFENYILKYVFYDRKSLELSLVLESFFIPFQQRTVNSINTLLGNFQSEEIVEFVTGEIQKIWKRWKSEKRPAFWEWVKCFYPINEVETLILIQEKIEETSPVEIPISALKPAKNEYSSPDDIITILRGFADSTENMEAALDLLFQYFLVRPDMANQFLVACTTAFGINRRSFSDEFAAQIKFINSAIQNSDNWENPYIAILFINIAKNWLQFDFSEVEASKDGNNVTYYSFSLVYTEGVTNYRAMVWEQLIKIASKGLYNEQLKEIVTSYSSGTDESVRDILKQDIPFLAKLFSMIYPVDELKSAIHCQNLYQRIDNNTDFAAQMSGYLQQEKLSIYNVMVGSEWDVEVPWDEYQEERSKKFEDYLKTRPDYEETIKDFLSVVSDVIQSECGDSYSICEAFIKLAEMVMLDATRCEYIMREIAEYKVSTAIYLGPIISITLSKMPPQDCYDIIAELNAGRRNFVYAFFGELPTEERTEYWQEKLYQFMEEDFAEHPLERIPGGIDFLDKYSGIDSEIWVKVSRIIYSGEKTTPGMIETHLGLLFNTYRIKPETVFKRFNADIALLEEIFLVLSSHHQERMLYGSGRYILEFTVYDGEFLRKFVHNFFLGNRRSTDQYAHVFHALYSAEGADYIAYIDTVIEEAIKAVKIPGLIIPNLIRSFLMPTKNTKGKNDCWGKHFVLTYCNETEKMKFFFEAISQFPIDIKLEYFKIYLSKNNRYEDFEQLPLIPGAYTCTGSLIPLYSKWIDSLNALRPILKGGVFLKHKKRVESYIEYLHNRIEEEELQSVLKG